MESPAPRDHSPQARQKGESRSDKNATPLLTHYGMLPVESDSHEYIVRDRDFDEAECGPAVDPAGLRIDASTDSGKSRIVTGEGHWHLVWKHIFPGCGARKLDFPARS